MGSRTRAWALIAVLASMTFAVWVWVSYLPAHQELEDLRRQLSALEMKEAKAQRRLEDLQRRLKEATGALQDLSQIQGLLLPAASLEEAGTRLQEIVQDYVERSQAVMQAYQLLKPSSWQGIPLAQVRFRFTAEPQALAELLRLLEEEPRLVGVDELSVVYRRKQKDALSVTLRVSTLFVDLNALKRSLHPNAQAD